MEGQTKTPIEVGDRVYVYKMWFNANTQSKEFYQEYEGKVILETDVCYKVKKNLFSSEWIFKVDSFTKIYKIL